MHEDRPGSRLHAPIGRSPVHGKRTGAWRNALQVFGWIAVCLLVAGALQFYTSYPWDTDTAYHAAVGFLIRKRGFLRSFPWTPFSWLADHYADKELLFHLLFVPLAGMDWVVAAKIVGTVAGATVPLALYLVLRSERVRSPGIWSLVPLAASGVFVFRMALVRPHLLSIALAVAVLWATSRERIRVLAAASAIYPWAYVAWQLPFVLVSIAEAARYASGERIRWKPAAACAAGVAAGLSLHPDSANLVRLSWIQIAEVLVGIAWQGREGFELGGEFGPFILAEWGKYLALSSLMTGVALAASWRDRGRDSTPLSFALTALAFGALTVKTARFAEYFVPFSVAALALSARWLPVRNLHVGMLCVSMIYTATFGSDPVTDLARRVEDMNPSVESALRENIPAGSQVFTCDWKETGVLLLALPERRFIVALDPAFFHAKDADLYRVWYRLPREAPPGSAGLIRERFGARYVLCPAMTRWSAFFERLISEPGVRLLYESDLWLLFDLGGHRR